MKLVKIYHSDLKFSKNKPLKFNDNILLTIERLFLKKQKQVIFVKNMKSSDIIIVSSINFKLLFKLLFKYKNKIKILAAPENINNKLSLYGILHYKFSKFIPKTILYNELILKLTDIKLFRKKYDFWFVKISQIFKIKNNLFILNNYLKNKYNYSYQSYFSNHVFKNSKELIEAFDNIKINNNKTQFCSFIVSNPNNVNRLLFYKKLSKYKKIDSFGAILNNSKFPKQVENKYIDCNDFWLKRFLINRDIFKNYKFVICFENSYNREHITEKIINAFLSGSIPIYRGPSNIHQIFNEKSFVNVTSFNKAIKKIIELDKNKDKYEKMVSEPKINSNDLFIKQEFNLNNFIMKKIIERF